MREETISEESDLKRRGKEATELVLEFMSRILKRRRNPKIRVQTVNVLDMEEITPVDFGTLDQAQVPVGTILACVVTAAQLQELLAKSPLEGKPDLKMWVKRDGRFVATAVSKDVIEARVVEETWI